MSEYFVSILYNKLPEAKVSSANLVNRLIVRGILLHLLKSRIYFISSRIKVA